MLKSVIVEIKTFGIKQFIWHLCYHITGKEKYCLLYYKAREKVYKLMTNNELKEQLNLAFYKNMGFYVDFENPRTFTEKVQCIKLQENEELINIMQKLADKYEVREYVTDKVGEQYLVPLLGVWNKPDELILEKLPDSFALKMNTGSGMNIIVKDKIGISEDNVRSQFEEWFENPFWVGTLEVHYKDMPSKIIVEKYIEEFGGGLLDYKFHCFNGEPIFIQCIGDRNLKKHTGYQKNYDLNWNELDWIFEDYPSFPYNVKKPQKLNEMIEVAKKLSKDFPYVRVDLYEINGTVLFGEMTFTPGGGMYPYIRTWTKEKDLYLGSLI